MKKNIVLLFALVIFTFSCSKEEIPLSNQDINFETSIQDNRSNCQDQSFTVTITWIGAVDNNFKIAKRAYYTQYYGRHMLMQIHPDGSETWIFHPRNLSIDRFVPGQCRADTIVDEVRQDPDIDDDINDDNSPGR